MHMQDCTLHCWRTGETPYASLTKLTLINAEFCIPYGNWWEYPPGLQSNELTKYNYHKDISYLKREGGDKKVCVGVLGVWGGVGGGGVGWGGVGWGWGGVGGWGGLCLLGRGGIESVLFIESS